FRSAGQLHALAACQVAGSRAAACRRAQSRLALAFAVADPREPLAQPRDPFLDAGNPFSTEPLELGLGAVNRLGGDAKRLVRRRNRLLSAFDGRPLLRPRRGTLGAFLGRFRGRTSPLRRLGVPLRSRSATAELDVELGELGAQALGCSDRLADGL